MLARSCLHDNESTYTSGRTIFGISQVFGDDDFLSHLLLSDGGLLALPWGSVGGGRDKIVGGIPAMTNHCHSKADLDGPGFHSLSGQIHDGVCCMWRDPIVDSFE